MNRVGAAAVAHSKNLDFTFSGDLRGQAVDLTQYNSYTFIIDIDGSVYQGATASVSQASVVIIGGVDKFVYSRSQELYSNFYITEQQKIALYKIMKELSTYYDNAVITSDNDKLEQALTTLYTNYCG
jgi:hypothetical protein